MQVNEYMIVSHANLETFTEQVTNFIRQGWMLHGSPYHTGNVHCQAIIRCSEKWTGLERRKSQG